MVHLYYAAIADAGRMNPQGDSVRGRMKKTGRKREMTVRGAKMKATIRMGEREEGETNAIVETLTPPT